MGLESEFIWGAATSSYQIEGAVNEDGRGLSVWDIFSREKDRVYEGDNGDIACDHYHRMREDVKLMAELGLQAYRFSISWPRILPEGTGKVNEAGIRFYSELIDELLHYDIVPYITLFHWDYPYQLQRCGGWLNPESPEWFAEYASVIAEHFGNRVKHYFTFNEPQIFMGCGYQEGIHAPGMKHGMRELLLMSHNIMLAHGKAVIKLRERVSGARVGYAPTCGDGFYPAEDGKEHGVAAQKAYDEITPERFLFSTEFWNEPILAGRYPSGWEEIFGSDMPVPSAEELQVMNQPLDFLGMNIYQGKAVLADGQGGVKISRLRTGHAKTGIGWPVTPECIYWAPKFLYEKYHLPIIITENGMSCHDVISLDGKVHDPNRIDYIQRHLAELKRVIADGIKVEGYFYWSLMDNFEWANGYNERFGLIFVDYQTQKRIPKDSFYWYRDIMKGKFPK